MHWRLHKAKYRLVGTECRTCGSLYYPPKMLCPKCRGKSDIKDYRFSGKGKILTHTVIRIAPGGFEMQVPYTVAIIKLDEGPCVAGQIIDDVNRIKTGQRVETVFRKMHEDGADGIIHYALKWKLAE
jgi:uncharacterized OB-fold protein